MTDQEQAERAHELLVDAAQSACDAGVSTANFAIAASAFTADMVYSCAPTPVAAIHLLLSAITVRIEEGLMEAANDC
jgi:predicted RNA methylase